MALFGGIFYWFPKMFGRMINDDLGRYSWLFIFTGFNVTFFPQFILGAMGMPRRYFDYHSDFHSLNQISTVGSWLIATGFLIALVAVIHGILKGEKAGDNPWGAKTLEWQTSSPPPHENFINTPTVNAGPYDYR